MKHYTVRLPGGRELEVRLDSERPYQVANVGGQARRLRVVDHDGAGQVTVEIDGVRIDLDLSAELEGVHVTPAPLVAPKDSGPVLAGQGPFNSPITGAVLEVCVEAGSRVKAGEPLVVIEAMKMENTLCAPADAVVTQVDIDAGTTVRKGDQLLVLGAQPPLH